MAQPRRSAEPGPRQAIEPAAPVDYRPIGLTSEGQQILAPVGPREERPSGHFVPTGRDQQVVELARAAVPHAEAYVNDVLDPQMYELRQFVAGQRGGGRVTEEALEHVRRLHDLVRTLPGEMSYQISQAGKVDDVKLEAPLERQIALMQSSYPWMAPKLVRLRHALSEQALMDNVARPAAQQIGLG